MKKLIKRLKFAWSAFKGEPYKVDDNSFVFPERIIQLINFRDNIVALDSTGKIYELRSNYSGFMVCSLIADNPVFRSY